MSDDNLLNEALKLLKFKKVIPPDETPGTDGYPHSYQTNRNYGDMEEGVEIRAEAAKRLGEIKDPLAIPHLRKSLYDRGDANGHSDNRVKFNYRGAYIIQKAAVDALVEIGGKEGVRALERKLKDVRGIIASPLSTLSTRDDIGVGEAYLVDSINILNT